MRFNRVLKKIKGFKGCWTAIVFEERMVSERLNKKI